MPQPRVTTYKWLRPGGPLVDVSTYAAGHSNGSIISTTGDVNRFLRALLGGRLLRPALSAQMRQTVRPSRTGHSGGTPVADSA